MRKSRRSLAELKVEQEKISRDCANGLLTMEEALGLLEALDIELDKYEDWEQWNFNAEILAGIDAENRKSKA